MTETDAIALLRQPTITIPQAAQILRVSRASAYEAARNGGLEVFEVGKRKLVITAPLRRKLGMES